MRVAVDTSSLLSLVRYYLPFDKKSILFDYIRNKIKTEEIIVIDKIHEECEYLSKGLVLKTLKYLVDPHFKRIYKVPVKTNFILAPSPGKFLRQIDNQCVNRVMKNRLTELQYESQKNTFLESPDLKLIVYCLNLIKNFPLEDVFLVTEETEGSNDSKLFKKIPAICKELGIQTITLPELLAKFGDIQFEFK